MVRKLIKRCAIALAAWLPFFAIWLLVAMSLARDRFSTVLIASLISMGSAGLLGIGVWYVCQRWPWPLGWVQTKLLFTSNLFCNGVWNRLDRVYLRCRIPARSKRLAGFLVMGRSGSADVDGSLVLCSIRGHFPCRADTQSVARKRDPCCARRSAGRSGALGCDSRPPESTLPVQRSAHAGGISEISSKHGGRRDRATRRHAALHTERRWPRAGGIFRGVRLHTSISCVRTPSL